MKVINLEKLKKSGLSFDEIEGIKRGLNDLEKGNTYDENEFYSNLEKRVFSKKKYYV